MDSPAEELSFENYLILIYLKLNGHTRQVALVSYYEVMFRIIENMLYYFFKNFTDSKTLNLNSFIEDFWVPKYSFL